MEGNTAGDAMPCGAVVRRMLLEGLAVAESIEDGWPLGGSTSKSCSPREWLTGPKIVVRRVSLLAVVGSACDIQNTDLVWGCRVCPLPVVREPHLSLPAVYPKPAPMVLGLMWLDVSLSWP